MRNLRWIVLGPVFGIALSLTGPAQGGDAAGGPPKPKCSIDGGAGASAGSGAAAALALAAGLALSARAARRRAGAR